MLGVLVRASDRPKAILPLKLSTGQGLDGPQRPAHNGLMQGAKKHLARGKASPDCVAVGRTRIGRALRLHQLSLGCPAPVAT